MKQFSEVLKNGAQIMNIDINDEQIRQFEVYLSYLLEYNSHTNLTAITNPSDIAVKHFLDSALVTKVVEMQDEIKMIDIGTGAGFPGVPVKILCPKIKLTLVDSLNKRITFLNNLVEKLGIKSEILHKRAEELSRNAEYRSQFDIVVSRAVAPLNILAEYCIPFLKKEGFFVAMKGPQAEDEIKNAENALKKLGGEIQKIEKFELPENNGSRSIVVVKKVKKTPSEYPRHGAKISKKPL